MKSPFEKSIRTFKEKQQEFAEDHYGKFVIIYDGDVIGFYDDQLTAYKYAKKEFSNEQFLLQQCVYPNEEVESVFHSRVR